MHTLHEQAKQTCSYPFLVPFLFAISYAGQCQPMSAGNFRENPGRMNQGIRQQLSYTNR